MKSTSVIIIIILFIITYYYCVDLFLHNRMQTIEEIIINAILGGFIVLILYITSIKMTDGYFFLK